MPDGEEEAAPSEGGIPPVEGGGETPPVSNEPPVTETPAESPVPAAPPDIAEINANPELYKGGEGQPIPTGEPASFEPGGSGRSVTTSQGAIPLAATITQDESGNEIFSGAPGAPYVGPIVDLRNEVPQTYYGAAEQRGNSVNSVKFDVPSLGLVSNWPGGIPGLPGGNADYWNNQPQIQKLPEAYRELGIAILQSQATNPVGLYGGYTHEQPQYARIPNITLTEKLILDAIYIPTMLDKDGKTVVDAVSYENKVQKVVKDLGLSEGYQQVKDYDANNPSVSVSEGAGDRTPQTLPDGGIKIGQFTYYGMTLDQAKAANVKYELAQVNVYSQDAPKAIADFNSKWSSLIQGNVFTGNKQQFAQYQKDFGTLPKAPSLSPETLNIINAKTPEDKLNAFVGAGLFPIGSKLLTDAQGNTALDKGGNIQIVSPEYSLAIKALQNAGAVNPDGTLDLGKATKAGITGEQLAAVGITSAPMIGPSAPGQITVYQGAKVGLSDASLAALGFSAAAIDDARSQVNAELTNPNIAWQSHAPPDLNALYKNLTTQLGHPPSGEEYMAAIQSTTPAYAASYEKHGPLDFIPEIFIGPQWSQTSKLTTGEQLAIVGKGLTDSAEGMLQLFGLDPRRSEAQIAYLDNVYPNLGDVAKVRILALDNIANSLSTLGFQDLRALQPNEPPLTLPEHLMTGIAVAATVFGPEIGKGLGEFYSKITPGLTEKEAQYAAESAWNDFANAYNNRFVKAADLIKQGWQIDPVSGMPVSPTAQFGEVFTVKSVSPNGIVLTGSKGTVENLTEGEIASRIGNVPGEGTRLYQDLTTGRLNVAPSANAAQYLSTLGRSPITLANEIDVVTHDNFSIAQSLIDRLQGSMLPEAMSAREALSTKFDRYMEGIFTAANRSDDANIARQAANLERWLSLPQKDAEIAVAKNLGIDISEVTNEDVLIARDKAIRDLQQAIEDSKIRKTTTVQDLEAYLNKSAPKPAQVVVSEQSIPETGGAKAPKEPIPEERGRVATATKQTEGITTEKGGNVSYTPSGETSLTEAVSGRAGWPLIIPAITVPKVQSFPVTSPEIPPIPIEPVITPGKPSVVTSAPSIQPGISPAIVVAPAPASQPANQPALAPQPSPAPAPQPAPEPSPAPQPSPAPKPTVPMVPPIKPSVPIRGRPPVGALPIPLPGAPQLSSGHGRYGGGVADEAGSKLTWKEGKFWVTAVAPISGWRGITKKDIKLTKKPPQGATILSGRGSAYKTIKLLSGTPPDFILTFDEGIMDIAVTPAVSRKAGAHGAIQFRQDKKKRTQSMVELKGIRVSD